MLLHPAVEGEIASPPATPVDGQCWLIAAPATDAFAGKERWLASSNAGTWLFAEPRDGMRVFDCATGQFLLHKGDWRREPELAEPIGGDFVDQEARSAIVAILHLRSRTGILPGE